MSALQGKALRDRICKDTRWAAKRLLGVTMWAQFKLNPSAPDPVQQQMFAIMPWMMMFIMAPFAAGLLVYWITNNCLSMAQQWWLYKRHPVLNTATATK